MKANKQSKVAIFELRSTLSTSNRKQRKNTASLVGAIRRNFFLNPEGNRTEFMHCVPTTASFSLSSEKVIYDN